MWFFLPTYIVPSFKCFSPSTLDILLPLSPFSHLMREFPLAPSFTILFNVKFKRKKVKLLFQSQLCASIYRFVNKHNSITRPHFSQVKNKKTSEKLFSQKTKMSKKCPFDSTQNLSGFQIERKRVFPAWKFKFSIPFFPSLTPRFLSCFNNSLIFRNEIRLMRKIHSTINTSSLGFLVELRCLQHRKEKRKVQCKQKVWWKISK